MAGTRRISLAGAQRLERQTSSGEAAGDENGKRERDECSGSGEVAF